LSQCGAGAAPLKLPINGSKIKIRKKPIWEDEMGIEILGVAVGVYATIWLIVITGSQFFGPR
jgi:hypothetical protein